MCIILKCVAASAAEVKLGALFMNCKEGVTYKTLLAMYLTFFTNMTISSFGFFTMIFFFEEDFH